MVPGVRLVRLLVKLPVPVPLLVVKLAVVGLVLVDQHTPLAVTAAPPSSVTFPPEAADVWVIALITAVVTVGSSIASVVNETWLP